MSAQSARFHGVSCAMTLVAAAVASACHKDAPVAPKAPEPAWQLLASELPTALLSVSARTAKDVFVVGADKGEGPMVLHFDGTKWSAVATGQHGDLWWVQAIPNGPTLFGGAGGMVLRSDGTTFERIPTPGLAKQTVFGVWGKSGDDFYAVGSAGGKNGFVWHFHDRAVETEKLPSDLAKTATGDLPGFYKVFGLNDDVWVVGANGTILHRKGSAAFTTVASGTKDTIFTVHGSGDHVVAVGGSGNGLVLQEASGAFKDASPPASGLLQGVFSTTTHGEWASGERGAIYSRSNADTPFAVVDHGLQLPPQSSLHSVTVDDAGGVWSAGGNVLTSALDQGMLVHYGLAVPEVVIDDDEEADAGSIDASTWMSCPTDVVAAGKNGSIARRWDEQALAAIRLDSRSTSVQARNLSDLSIAMWDAWAAYDGKAIGILTREKAKADDVAAARAKAISHAAYDVLAQRYAQGPRGEKTKACLDAVMVDLGLDPNDAHETGDDPTAVGRRIGHAVRLAAPDPTADGNAVAPSAADSKKGLLAAIGAAEALDPDDKATMPDGTRRFDFVRVTAEYWADGPNAETPAGHWNVLANAVADAPDAPRKLFGKGDAVDALSWDVHVYVALNDALHAAALGVRERAKVARPAALIHGSAGKDLPLVPGLVEIVTATSSAPGQRHEALASFVGDVAILGWRGEPGDRKNRVSGSGWVRAVDWTPYERGSTIAGEHSAFARAGADVLGAITAKPSFPGGSYEFVAPKNAFLRLEEGPTNDVRLRFTTYADAADQAGQSRVRSGAELATDDIAGRAIGRAGAASALARDVPSFEGVAPTKR